MTLEGRPLKYIQCLIVLFILSSNKRIKGEYHASWSYLSYLYCISSKIVSSLQINGSVLDVVSINNISFFTEIVI